MNMIEVEHLWKTFKIPNEKRNTVFETLMGIFDTKKRYRELTALKDINFCVKKGEWLGVIGPNGSGKSTLLKIIANTIRPVRGEVKVHGKITSFLELGIGFHPELTAIENIFLYDAIMGFADADIRERLDGILDFAGLKRFSNTKLKNFSSGMVVRLAFSTAIQTDPEILLFDEVLAVGDLEFQQKCFEVFERYKKEGKTVLYVSHDMDSVRRFCEKTLLLNHGSQIALGNTDEVIDMHVYDGLLEPGGLGQNVTDLKSGLSTEPIVVKSGKGRWGDKQIEITNVKLLDRFEKEQLTFTSGDLIKIQIFYNSPKIIEEPVFGISIHSEEGLHCFGTNTELKNFSIDSVEGIGQIDLILEKIPMIEGKYLISVAVHSKSHYHYDWLDKKFLFNVVRGGKADGLFDIPCRWEIEKTS